MRRRFNPKYQFAFWDRYADRGDCPAAQLVELLSEAKRRGEPFECALADALPRLRYASGKQRKDWEVVWADPRIVDAWWAAYMGVPHRWSQVIPSMEPAVLEAAAAEYVAPLAISTHPGRPDGASFIARSASFAGKAA